MNNFEETLPNSPLAVAQNLLEAFLQGQMNPDDFSLSLERFETVLEEWEDGLEAMEVPQDAEDVEEAKVLYQAGQEGFALIGQGLEVFMELLDCEDEAAPEIVREGLELIENGQNLLMQVKGIADQKTTAAIGESKYMD